ncbi:MAG TPA: site-specific integrase [Propionibacteriaceae bacterium]|nr:site-specific integrase [Propionibacteriaceae bacterium]
MSASYKWRPDRRTWEVTITWNYQRKRVQYESEADAKEIVRHIRKLELEGVNVFEAITKARTATRPTPTAPRLREVLPLWLDRQVLAGQIRASTGRLYARCLRGWCYTHPLEDGRALGDLPIDAVTREMLGAMIRRMREAKLSGSTIGNVHFPLRSYFADLIETKKLLGPSPAGDLKYFVGKASRTASKRRHYPYFTQDEGPVLMAAAQALFPRWYPFILTGVLAGLRWGETAALRRTDLNVRKGTLTVERTISDRGEYQGIAPVKDYEFRTVKVAPKLLAVLQSHLEAVTLEGQVKEWKPEGRALMFPTVFGNPVPYPYFWQSIWRPLMRKSGLPVRNYHATRHTYATWLLEDGANIHWVSQQLGHATIKQTVDTYGHIQPDRHEGAVEGLDRYV